MISVLMGVHRIDEFVIPAIDSILSQEGVELELVIVANGKSAKQVEQVIREHYKNDSRICIYVTPIGQLAHALNVALSHARYKYVARMDADDIAHPDRLCKQLEYIKSTENEIVGTAVRLIDPQGGTLGNRVSPKGVNINRLLPFKNCFVHPTIISLKQTLLDAGGYIGGFNSEDYDLWLRLRRKGVKWDNMPDVLLDDTVHNAAPQRRLLGYAETTGLMIREFIISKKLIWLLAALLSFVKSLCRARSNT